MLEFFFSFLGIGICPYREFLLKKNPYHKITRSPFDLPSLGPAKVVKNEPKGSGHNIMYNDIQDNIFVPTF